MRIRLGKAMSVDEAGRRIDLVVVDAKTNTASLGIHTSQGNWGLGLDWFHEKNQVTAAGIIIGPMWLGVVVE